MRRALPLLALTSALALACGGDEPEPTPRPLPPASETPEREEVASPEEQAERIARNPRLLLFDVQTALESAKTARGAYPTSAEFEAGERWSLQRAALSAAFEEWSYESDGTSYRLDGTQGGRTFTIESDPGDRS